MHIKIAYYSGSGNTQYVSVLLRKFLSKGHKVSMFYIKKGKVMDDDFDALVLGMPVYAYRPPETVVDFLKGLSGNGRSVFIFITKGLISGDAGRIAALILKERGFKVKGANDILMADSLFVLLAKKGSLLHKIMLFPNRGIEKKVENLAEHIQRSLIEEDEYIPRKKIYVPFTSLIATMFWKKEKIWQTEFFADERCDLCGACVGLCPTHNINIKNGRVLWGNDCDFCMRCLHRCPKQAIQIGKYTLKSPRYKGPIN